jgi:hypothetical protein
VLPEIVPSRRALPNVDFHRNRTVSKRPSMPGIAGSWSCRKAPLVAEEYRDLPAGSGASRPGAFFFGFIRV